MKIERKPEVKQDHLYSNDGINNGKKQFIVEKTRWTL